MIIKLIPMIWYNREYKYWRLSWYGIQWRWHCECDNVRGCIVAYQFQPYLDEDWAICAKLGRCSDKETGEAIDTCECDHFAKEMQTYAGDCPCTARPAHTHSRVGFLQASRV